MGRGQRQTTASAQARTTSGRDYVTPAFDCEPLDGAVTVIGITDDELRDPTRRPLLVKLGCDPTAPDLHLGHLVLFHRVRALQRLGHEPVLIIGDFTASIGDPTGRSAERPVLTATQIDASADRFVEQMQRHVEDGVEVRRNSEWLDMPARELMDLTRHVTMAQLLEREDFRTRIEREQPLSLTEVMYPLMQAYDSVAIGADLELGGSDQLFNLMAGRSLQRGMEQSSQAIATFPLLVGLDGQRKMSKSLGNHIALDDSPADVYGKTMSIPDTAVEQWCSLLLLAPSAGAERAPMERKRLLARSLVALVCAPDQVDGAEEAFGHAARRLAPSDMAEVEVRGSVHVPAVFAEHFDVSRNQVRRWISDGALQRDGQVVEDLDLPAEEAAGQWRVGRRWLRLTTRA